MKRLTDYQIQKIKELRQMGFSLNKIKDRLELKKTTVYYWIRKFFGRSIKKVRLDKSNQEIIGELIGAFAGDGSYFCTKNYEHLIRFHIGISEIDYAKRLAYLIELIYNKKPRVYIDEKYNVITIVIVSRDVINHIKTYLSWNKDRKKVYTVHLKKDISKYSKAFLKGFIRGLFDTDGFSGKNSIIVASVSKELIQNTAQIMNLFQIKHSVRRYKGKANRKDIYYLRILSASRIKFLQTIELKNLKKFNAPVGI